MTASRLQNEARELTTPELSLGEMLRIMDVARVRRRDEDIALEQFQREEIKARLRDRLLASTEITGDQVTAAEIDAAIDQYFDNLHAYRDPPWSPSLVFAHLYIRRWLILGLLVIATLVAFYLWR